MPGLTPESHDTRHSGFRVGTAAIAVADGAVNRSLAALMNARIRCRQELEMAYRAGRTL